MALNIWLDDIRPAPNGYVWVKSVNQAKRLIIAAEIYYEEIFELNLDHDLGDYAEDGGDAICLVRWLAETGRHYFIKLHTQNVVGRENMQAIIDRYWNR